VQGLLLVALAVSQGLHLLELLAAAAVLLLG
jgi:hypothetical protein